MKCLERILGYYVYRLILLVFMFFFLHSLQPMIATIEASEKKCPEGTLFSARLQKCAKVENVREDMKKLSDEAALAKLPDLKKMRMEKARPLGMKSDGTLPKGGLEVGITYKQGKLQALVHAQLDTEMYVHPDGLNPSHSLDWLFTTATNRTEKTVEVVGVYSSDFADKGQVSLFDWSCSASYPCDNGSAKANWVLVWWLSDIPQYITQIVGKDGHIQKMIYYANVSYKDAGKEKEGSTADWTNAVYFWNFEKDHWDCIYAHFFGGTQKDCSQDSYSCGWWGPILETFGDGDQPKIKEVGFEDSWLYHDGSYSNLGTGETDFTPPGSPWELFFLDPNRGFGAGNYFVPSKGGGS